MNVFWAVFGSIAGFAGWVASTRWHFQRWSKPPYRMVDHYHLGKPVYAPKSDLVIFSAGSSLIWPLILIVRCLLWVITVDQLPKRVQRNSYSMHSRDWERKMEELNNIPPLP